MAKTKVAIVGSGNIGTDLMIKILETSDVLEMAAERLELPSAGALLTRNRVAAVDEATMTRFRLAAMRSAEAA